MQKSKIYKITQYLYENNEFNCDYIGLPDGDEFVIEEYDINSYLVHFSDISYIIKYDIVLDDLEADEGSWVKEYTFEDVTNQYKKSYNQIREKTSSEDLEKRLLILAKDHKIPGFFVPDNKIGVHQTHCCKEHGCKYGQDDICPVVIGTIEQKYPCIDC